MKTLLVIITLLSISCAHRPMPSEIYNECMVVNSNESYCMNQVQLDQMDYEYQQEKIRGAATVRQYIQQIYQPAR